MDSKTIYHLILILAVLFFSLLFLLIPLKYVAQLTIPFSFKTFGIRKIRRWHSRTDTLANLFLWISVILAFAFPFIPEARLAYGIWLTFTWLCTLSRAVRLSQIRKGNIKLTVIFMLNLIYGFGMLSGLGLLDDQGLWIRSETIGTVQLFVGFDLVDIFQKGKTIYAGSKNQSGCYGVSDDISSQKTGFIGIFKAHVFKLRPERAEGEDHQGRLQQVAHGGLENPAPEAESHPEEQLENLPESQPEEQPENPEPVPVE